MLETVLVTGGTGYIGGWCIVELLKRGYTVRTTVRSLAKEAGVRADVAAAVDAGDRLHFFVADLTKDAGWDAAVTGCDYVLHVASPLGGDVSKDPNALIGPARDGALRVLRAATQAGVRRVVMTSACAAASPALYSEAGVTDETLWTDPEDKRLSPYRKSKTVAELAAWQFMQDYHGPTSLTTILPGAVFGPVLSADNVGTAQVIGRLLRGRMPGIPHLAFEVVDVRDLADVHIRAMSAEQAAGQRFIAVSEFIASSCGWLRSRRYCVRGLAARPATCPRERCQISCCASSRSSTLSCVRSRRAWGERIATARPRRSGCWAGCRDRPQPPSSIAQRV